MISPETTKATATEYGHPAATLQVDVIADLICPWCYLGKKRLDNALTAVRGPSLVTWYPFQINPTMPVEGMPFADYLAIKFGDPERLEPGLAISGTEYVTSQQIRPQITQRFVDAVFAEADVFHAPTINIPVPSIEETDVKASPEFPAIVAGMVHCTSPINYLGLPSLAVPAGFSENGLPASFQLIGRPFAEATLYRAAAAYEAETRFFENAPS